MRKSKLSKERIDVITVYANLLLLKGKDAAETYSKKEHMTHAEIELAEKHADGIKALQRGHGESGVISGV
jgi:hypothetical protein